LGGALGRENVGISNRKTGERPVHRKPKVSLAMFINQGLVGPKEKPRGEAEGQPVNIPAPFRFFNGVTKFSSLSDLLDYHSLFKDVCQANPAGASPRIEIRLVRQSIQMSKLPRKTSRAKNSGTVPKTNTGGRGE